MASSDTLDVARGRVVRAEIALEQETRALVLNIPRTSASAVSAAADELVNARAALRTLERSAAVTAPEY